jgi:alginate O-acetyltransferase complex protein AlgI
MALWAPNSNRIGHWLEQRAEDSSAAWWIGTLGLMLALLMVLLNTVRDSVSAFIYFNF